MTFDAAFAKFPELGTERLRLRAPRPEDAEAIFVLKSDPEVTGPYGAEPHTSLDQSRSWVRDRVADYARRDGLLWVVALRDTDVAIGSCCFWHFEPGDRTVELGYELARAYWGRGFAAEAVAAVVRYGFTEMELHRIEACPLARNAPSHRLLLRLGFVLEGTLRDRVRRADGFEDQAYYGLLRDEWRDARTGPQRER